MEFLKMTAMRVRPWLLGVIAIAVCLLFAYVSLREKADSRVAADSMQTALAKSSSASSSASPAPVKSWEGTDVAGEIHLDGAGNIIPDRALHELFDYMRSAVGQIDDVQMRAHLLEVGRQFKLTGSRLAQLDGLFSKYLDYLQAVTNIQPDSADVGSLRKVMEARYWMRRDLLGFAMAEGFFSSSEAEDRYVIERMEVMADKTLSADQRAQRLAALSASEPAERHAALQPSQALADLSSRTEQMRQTGASAEQIQSMRVQSVGSEAAERLATLDQEQAAWTRRMQALEAARQQIMADPNVPADDKQHRIDDLVARDFSGPEALRASAILGIAGTPK